MEPSKNDVAKQAGRMGLATLMSRILGLAREQVFAYLFGASNATDAFNIAFRIPNLLRDLFAEGAMSAAFVPNFTAALSRSKQEAFRLFIAVLTVLVVLLSAISLLGMIFSQNLVALYAGSFAVIPGKMELTAGLTRVMFPFFPMVAMAAVAMGALNALGSFFLPAFAPVLFNVASIACGLVLTPVLAKTTEIPPIYSMAIGVVIGGFLQFYIQWWQIRRQGLKLREFPEAITHPFKVQGVKHVLWLLIPGTIGLAATQLNIFVNSVYATSQGSGAVSWLNYAFRLMQFPIGIFGVSLAAATLPAVSRKLVAQDKVGAAESIADSLKLVMAINGPATAGLMIAGMPIIQLLFQHGLFGASDSFRTADALFWYSIGLTGYSAVKVMVPVFYALGTTRIPVTISFVAVGLNALMNHVFLEVFHFGFQSLALATSITATTNALVLGFFLQKRLPGSVGLSVLKALFVHGMLSLAVAGSAWGVLHVMVPYAPSAGMTRILFWAAEVAISIGVAIGVWLGVGRIAGVGEVNRVFELVLRRFRKK